MVKQQIQGAQDSNVDDKNVPIEAIPEIHPIKMQNKNINHDFFIILKRIKAHLHEL